MNISSLRTHTSEAAEIHASLSVPTSWSDADYDITQDLHPGWFVLNQSVIPGGYRFVVTFSHKSGMYLNMIMFDTSPEQESVEACMVIPADFGVKNALRMIDVEHGGQGRAFGLNQSEGLALMRLPSSAVNLAQ